MQYVISGDLLEAVREVLATLPYNLVGGLMRQLEPQALDFLDENAFTVGDVAPEMFPLMEKEDDQ